MKLIKEFGVISLLLAANVNPVPSYYFEFDKGFIGNDVKVSVMVENSPNFWGIDLYIPVNTDYFTYVGYSIGDYKEAINLIDYNNDVLHYVCIMNNKCENGKLFDFTLHVKEDANPGLVNFEIINKQTINELGNEIYINTISKEMELSNLVLGDTNNDGSIDLKDILNVGKFITNSDKYPLLNEKAADVNLDGVIDIRDIQRLYRFILNETEYPLG